MCTDQERFLTLTLEAKKMKVEILSRDYVKPSFPTPVSKRHYQLSMFDLLLPFPTYSPVIYFYHSPAHSSSVTSSLKSSLSKTLHLFYPFAGQFNNDFKSVDCNDHGAYFLEARIISKLSDFLRNPDPETVTNLLPTSDPKTHRDAVRNKVITLVKLTTFSCGGIVIGFEVSHRLADGFSSSRFTKTWAAISSGNQDVAQPIFGGASLFPPPTSPLKFAARIWPKTRLRSIRLVFSSAKLADLKKEIQQNGDLNFSPSTLEVISSLLFKCVAGASGDCALVQAANLRNILKTSLPENCIGNLTWPLIVSGKGKHPKELHEIATTTRKGMSDFISYCKEDKLEREVLVSMVSRFVEEDAELVRSGIKIILFTFLSSFRSYETNFGWGEPAWIASPQLLNIPMLHSKSGKDVEVWVSLDENVIEKLVKNQELLAFASFTVPENSAGGHSRL